MADHDDSWVLLVCHREIRLWESRCDKPKEAMENVVSQGMSR